MQNELMERLQKLEKLIVKLNEHKVRMSERLALYRQQRDNCLNQLKEYNISGESIKVKIQGLSDEIETKLIEIENKIPVNIEELLQDDTEDNN